MRNAVAWLAAAASGAALWLCANLVQGTQEPWDGEAYWTTWLPLAVALCFVLGFAFPEKAWRWPIAVMFVQLPVMIMFTGRVGPLWLVGVSHLLLLSLPGILVALLGAGARRWAGPRSGR